METRDGDKLLRPGVIRHRLYRNVRELARATSLLDRVGAGLALHLLAA